MESRLRKLIVLVGIVLLTLGLVSCNDDDDDDSPAARTEQRDAGPSDGSAGADSFGNSDVALPGTMDFSLIANADTTAPLVVSQVGTTPLRYVEVRNTEEQPVTGTVAMTREDGGPAALVTFDPGTVVEASAQNFWDEGTQDLTIAILEPLAFTEGVLASGEALPSTGSYSVSYDDQTGDANTITVIMNGSSEISMEINEGGPVVMDPATFNVLLGSTEDSWRQMVQLSFIALKKLANAVALSASTVGEARDRAGALAPTAANQGGTGQVLIPGDQLTLEGDPENPVMGSRILVWTDERSNGRVGRGDSFQWIFTDYWENRGDAVVNDHTTGIVDLSGFIMQTESRDGQAVLTRTGFQNKSNTRQGVLFTDFEQSELEEVDTGVFFIDPDRVFVMNGGFDLLFNE